MAVQLLTACKNDNNLIIAGCFLIHYNNKWLDPQLLQQVQLGMPYVKLTCFCLFKMHN